MVNIKMEILQWYAACTMEMEESLSLFQLLHSPINKDSF
jgi:hypothetical protein